MSNSVKQMGPITKSWLDKCFLQNRACTTLGLLLGEQIQTENWTQGESSCGFFNVFFPSFFSAGKFFLYSLTRGRFVGLAFIISPIVQLLKTILGLKILSLVHVLFPIHRAQMHKAFHYRILCGRLFPFSPQAGLADLQFRFSENWILPFILCSEQYGNFFLLPDNDSQAAASILLQSMPAAHRVPLTGQSYITSAAPEFSPGGSLTGLLSLPAEFTSLQVSHFLRYLTWKEQSSGSGLYQLCVLEDIADTC